MTVYKPDSIWNKIPGLFEELKKAISDKLSGRQAADKLSLIAGQRLSRSAVLGYANRRGMSFQSTDAGLYPRAPKKPRRQVPINIVRKRTPLPLVEITETPVQQGFLGLTFEQMEGRRCWYPHGEQVPYLFCGNPIHGKSSWCLHHFRIVSAGYSTGFNKTGVSNELHASPGGSLSNSRGRAG